MAGCGGLGGPGAKILRHPGGFHGGLWASRGEVGVGYVNLVNLTSHSLLTPTTGGSADMYICIHMLNNIYFFTLYKQY